MENPYNTLLDLENEARSSSQAFEHATNQHQPYTHMFKNPVIIFSKITRNLTDLLV